MNSKRRVFLNSLSGAGLFGVSLVAAFVLAPVLIHGLGNRDYSVWELVLGFLAYFRILDLGVAPALVRNVARGVAAEDWNRVRAVHHTAMSGLGLASLVSILGFSLIALHPEPLLNIRPGDLAGSTRLFLFTGLALGAQFFGISFSAYLQGLQKHYLVNTIRGTVLVLQTLGFYAVAAGSRPEPLADMAAVYLGASVLEYGVYALLVLAGPGRAPLRPWSASRSVLRELYLFGFKSFTLMMADRLRKASLPFVITHLAGVAQVVYFAQPARLMDFALNFTSFLHQPMMPYFSAVSSGGDVTATRRAWFSMSRALQFLVLFLALGIFFLGVPFIHRWLGSEYAREGYWVVKILALSLFVEAFSCTSLTILVSLNGHGKAGAWAVGLSVASIAAALPLVSWQGVSGAAAALAGANVAISLTFLHMACKSLDTGVFHFLARTGVRFLAPLAAAGFVLWFLGNREAPLTYPALIFHGAAGAVVYLALGWWLALNPAERLALRGALTRSKA